MHGWRTCPLAILLLAFLYSLTIGLSELPVVYMLRDIHCEALYRHIIHTPELDVCLSEEVQRAYPASVALYLAVVTILSIIVSGPYGRLSDFSSSSLSSLCYVDASFAFPEVNARRSLPPKEHFPPLDWEQLLGSKLQQKSCPYFLDPTNQPRGQGYSVRRIVVSLSSSRNVVDVYLATLFSPLGAPAGSSLQALVTLATDPDCLGRVLAGFSIIKLVAVALRKPALFAPNSLLETAPSAVWWVTVVASSRVLLHVVNETQITRTTPENQVNEDNNELCKSKAIRGTRKSVVQSMMFQTLNLTVGLQWRIGALQIFESYLINQLDFSVARPPKPLQEFHVDRFSSPSNQVDVTDLRTWTRLTHISPYRSAERVVNQLKPRISLRAIYQAFS
ncbi:hypothetical protein AcV5_001605 [Taiwanofungus camphoratus]|nr:hypothetical protein AcV5_001605 [Antrodia cinnamomea]